MNTQNLAKKATYVKPDVNTKIPYKEFYCTAEEAKDQIKTKGVAVVKNVLSPEELKTAREELWATLEEITQNFKVPFKFADKSTWRSFYDLMPLHGMLLQHWGVGQTQFVWNIRQNPKVANVFAKIWNCEVENLVVSFDGMSVSLCPEVTNKGYFRGNMWSHVDQSYTKPYFLCIQGMVTLWDADEGDATLLVHEGSNNVHKAFGKKFGITDKSNWYKINSDEQYEFMADYPQVCVKAKAGSLILWDSRTCHQGIEPRKERANKDTIRCVVYTCYLPRSNTNSKELQKKIEAFEMGRTTSHWPYPVKMFPKYPRTYGNPLPNVTKPAKPILTPLGKRLAGYR